MSRFEETLRTVPPTTLGVIGVCTLLYLVQIFADMPPLHSVTFSPSLVLYQGQVYRIVTSTVYHANFMHIGMNMMSTLAIGTMLEKRLGTLRLFCTILLSMAVSSVLYIAVALALDVGLERHGLMNQHSVGFSGVIFHWLVLECNLLTHESNRSVFGVVQVPAHLYPWVM
jgi:membrane associated rhomboid family serine protease